MIKRTILYDYHRTNGHLAEFAGYEMPMWYEGIIPETMSVRDRAGIFDVSHMGRIFFTGEDAPRFLDHVATAELSTLQSLQARYCMLCNEGGSIIDDMIVVRLEEKKYLAVWNATNREKNLNWVQKNATRYSIAIDDVSDRTFMLALQGPLSQEFLQGHCEVDLGILKRNRGVWGKVEGVNCLITRTGYTGEDGFELISIELQAAEKVWSSLIASGATPAGLGARDVLRMEAGLALYGNEIDESTNPLEARLEFAVNLDKPEFIGKETLLKVQAKGLKRYLMGIRMVGRGIPRKGFELIMEGKKIGYVTSGTFSPTLNAGIAIGYVYSALPCGTEITVDIRGKACRGIITEMPFYDQGKYGRTRTSNAAGLKPAG